LDLADAETTSAKTATKSGRDPSIANASVFDGILDTYAPRWRAGGRGSPAEGRLLGRLLDGQYRPSGAVKSYKKRSPASAPCWKQNNQNGQTEWTWCSKTRLMVADLITSTLQSRPASPKSIRQPCRFSSLALPSLSFGQDAARKPIAYRDPGDTLTSSPHNTTAASTSPVVSMPRTYV